MKHWKSGILGMATIMATGFSPTSAQQQPAPEAMQIAPEGAPAKVAEPAWNSFEFVLTGMLDEVKYGPVGRSFPPVYSVELVFTIEKSIRGSLKAGEKLSLHHSARQIEKPTYPEGETCIVGGMTGDHDMKILSRIEKSDPEKLAAVISACQLPLGWTMSDGKAISPWSAWGESFWPKASGNLGATITCSKSGRPALACGEGVELSIKPVPPEKSIQWTNPDGDGYYEITVTNKTDKALKVPALLTDGKDIQWSNSLVILCQGKTYSAPGCKNGLTKLEPVTLPPGASVSGTVNALALTGPDWPQGGYRISFQFCLGEKSVSHSFYYMSKHHDALRDAAQKANPPPAAPNGEITWEEMLGIIKNGTVVSAGQTHARRITITMDDGKTFHATSPEIDMIFDVLKKSGKPVPPMCTE